MLILIFSLLCLMSCDKSTDPRVIEDPLASLNGIHTVDPYCSGVS